MIELHHNRKHQQEPRSTPTLADLYGSVWITGGAGSVILLTGSPGDLVVGFLHLKQPSDDVGPLRIIHDHQAGRSQVFHAVDLVALAKQRTLTAMEAAAALFETEKPTPNEREKARRRLTSLTEKGLLKVVAPGVAASSLPTEWRAT